MAKHIAIYIRVSGPKQDTRSQEPDLRRWAEAYGGGAKVVWYRDKATGKTMDRPGWRQLETDMRAGKVETVVVWRLDRLGRTASGLTSLFDELQGRAVGLVSVRDGLDLGTPAGRLMAGVLASVAQYENEVRSERIAAGQAAARAAGKRWGGSKPGRRSARMTEKDDVIRQMHQAGKPIAKIARTVGVARGTVYSIIRAPAVNGSSGNHASATSASGSRSSR